VFLDILGKTMKVFLRKSHFTRSCECFKNDL